MKKYLLITFLCLITLHITAQSKIEQLLKNIHTPEQANDFIDQNKNLQAELLKLSSVSDTSITDKQIFKHDEGDAFKIGSYFYKIITATKENAFRVSYIYLDGSVLSLKSIDSIRKIILAKYKDGKKFGTLADKYNMDGNPAQGDTGFFGEGDMVVDFERAIKAKKIGEVFNVDIPAKNWYYVVKKTYNNTVKTKLVVVRIKNT